MAILILILTYLLTLFLVIGFSFDLVFGRDKSYIFQVIFCPMYIPSRDLTAVNLSKLNSKITRLTYGICLTYF